MTVELHRIFSDTLQGFAVLTEEEVNERLFSVKNRQQVRLSESESTTSTGTAGSKPREKNGKSSHKKQEEKKQEKLQEKIQKKLQQQGQCDDVTNVVILTMNCVSVSF